MSLLLLLANLALAEAYECPDYAADPTRLHELEPYATRGALNTDETTCLESRYAEAGEQTLKDKISRVLMVNAYATSTKDWALLVRRHLDEVDRSDPDIAYLYAFYLYNSDHTQAGDAIAWANVALERKDAWTGKVHVARVYGLLQLRSVAAVENWRMADEALVAGTGTAADTEQMRHKAKTYAREWVDFATVSKRSLEHPLAVCLSIASEEACGVHRVAGESDAPDVQAEGASD